MQRMYYIINKQKKKVQNSTPKIKNTEYNKKQKLALLYHPSHSHVWLMKNQLCDVEKVFHDDGKVISMSESSLSLLQQAFSTCMEMLTNI